VVLAQVAVLVPVAVLVLVVVLVRAAQLGPVAEDIPAVVEDMTVIAESIESEVR
jgi:hypothetical protein